VVVGDESVVGGASGAARCPTYPLGASNVCSDCDRPSPLKEWRPRGGVSVAAATAHRTDSHDPMTLRTGQLKQGDQWIALSMTSRDVREAWLELVIGIVVSVMPTVAVAAMIPRHKGFGIALTAAILFSLVGVLSIVRLLLHTYAEIRVCRRTAADDDLLLSKTQGAPPEGRTSHTYAQCTVRVGLADHHFEGASRDNQISSLQ